MPRRDVPPPERSPSVTSGCWIVTVVLAIAGVAAAFVWRGAASCAVLLALPLAFALREQASTYLLLKTASREFALRNLRGVLVYSRSPNWQEYIESHWLPTLGDHLTVLNWSERRNWNEHDLAVRIYRRFVGHGYEHNPAAVLLDGTKPPLVFRFYSAFKNAKHQKREDLERLERAFFKEVTAA